MNQEPARERGCAALGLLTARIETIKRSNLVLMCMRQGETPVRKIQVGAVGRATVGPDPLCTKVSGRANGECPPGRSCAMVAGPGCLLLPTFSLLPTHGRLRN